MVRIWIGFDLNVFYWIGLDWIDFEWFRIGLDWICLDLVFGLEWLGITVGLVW